MTNKPVVVDVREPFEFTQSHVEGALNVPLSELMNGNFSDLTNTPHDAEIILYCRSGGRAAQAQHILQLVGFHNVRNGINQSEIEGNRCDG